MVKGNREKNHPAHLRISFKCDLGLNHNEGQLTFNCPEKQKLDFRFEVKKVLFRHFKIFTL